MEENALKNWVDMKGRGAWTELFRAIRAEFPRFAQALMTDYIQGNRLPHYEVVKIISRVTGIPLSQLPFKYHHNPKAPEELSPGQEEA
jgi:hypothetical protein